MASKWLTRAEARKALGNMPERTFARWCAKGMPCKEGKSRGRTAMKYPWPEIYRWQLEQIERRAKESARPATIDQAKTRQAAAEAEMAELKLAKMRGELMTVERYQEALRDSYGRVAAQLLTLPVKLAPRVAPAMPKRQALAVVKAAVNEVMEELYNARDIPDKEVA